jgi:copper chaperone
MARLAPYLHVRSMEEADMLTLNVAGMTCDHCVKAVTNAVRGIPGAGAVVVDLDRGTVAVQGTPDVAAVRAAIVDEGYDVAA